MSRATEKLSTLLNEYVKNKPLAKVLVWLDDGFSFEDFNFKGGASQVVCVSNRFDNIDSLAQQNINALFTDFSLKKEQAHFDAVFYRVSKERFVSHHILNNSISVLKEGSPIFIVGKKEDGIKTYREKLIKQCGFTGELKKEKDLYSAQLSIQNPDKESTQLDDGNYTELRLVCELEINNTTFTLHSKPGVYGWKKIDTGSQFLIDSIRPHLQKTHSENIKSLDLGCGSGYLSLALSSFGFSNITATDNSASAMLACTENFKVNGIDGKTIADDCGKSLTERFDLIICNPPFHQGFDTSSDLTLKFVKACKRLLNKKGNAYFVTNSFIGIEKLFNKEGLKVNCLANNKQFKALHISH